jgi:hypothetical protein
MGLVKRPDALRAGPPRTPRSFSFFFSFERYREVFASVHLFFFPPVRVLPITNSGGGHKLTQTTSSKKQARRSRVWPTREAGIL